MKQVDYKVFFAVAALIIFWMIMISSVSIWGSHRITSIQASQWLIESAYNHFYVKRNISHVIMSLVLIGVLVKVPYKLIEKNAKYIFGFSLVLLVVVLLKGESYKWATGWLSIPGIPFNIQPTEFLKYALIVQLAAFFKQSKKFIHTFDRWFLPFAGIIWTVLLLVGAQPDFWTILVIVPLAFMMFFIAWANIKYLSLMFLMGLFVAFWVYLSGDYNPETGENLNNLWYITQRIDNFLADNKEAISNKTINYQTEQAIIAIWSWGFTGLWFGSSIQKFWYLPEVQGDFIFSVIVEELWFLWAITLLSFYLYIGYKGLIISRYSPDLFAKYAAFGVTCWFVLQAFINIWVNLNIVPLTGITLPFISYGGSSLLSLSFALALLLSISRDVDMSIKHEKNVRFWARHKISLRKRLWL